jgi:hypothetical protein
MCAYGIEKKKEMPDENTAEHNSRPRTLTVLLTGAILVAALFLFHGSALKGGWHLDDGHHLAYAVKYSPFDYFFTPKVIAEFSYGQFITPWNPLVYDINISLFGLNIRYFYLHQLLALLAGAVAFYMLMRQWVSHAWASFGALLLIAGPQSGHLVRDLMCGHYLYGLVFACFASMSYVRAIRTDSVAYAWVGAGLYALTLTTKEIYAPLPLVLALLDEGPVRRRVRFLLPIAIIAGIYPLWRYTVLGMFVGGYSRDPSLPSFSAMRYAKSVAISLFGNLYPLGAIGTFSLATYLIKKRLIGLCLLIGATFASLGSLLAFPLPPAADRITFGAWLAFVTFITYALHAFSAITKKRWIPIAIALAVFGNTLWHFQSAIKINDQVRREHEVTSSFLLQSNERQAFVDKKTSWYPSFNVLTPLKEVEKAIVPASPKRALVTYEEEIALKARAEGKIDSIWIFDPICTCMRQIQP